MKEWFKILIVPTLVALLVAGVANGAVYQWSPTAATNATADPTINWAEGMSPSSVNDSARAMMARIANWRDDFSGSLVTGGTGSAYTLTTKQGFPNPPTDAQLVAFTAHATNTAGATLAADGGTARPFNAPDGTAIPAGVILPGGTYTARYSGGNGVWVLRDYYTPPGLVPIGTILDYSAPGLPSSNFVLANGQCISQTTYAAYFAMVGSTFGTCGAGLFAVPDLSNRMVAGTQMGGTARITIAGGNFDGTVIGAAGGGQNYTLSVSEIPFITPAGSIVCPSNPCSYTPQGGFTGALAPSDTRTWQTNGNVWSNGTNGGRTAGTEFSAGAGQMSVTPTGFGSLSVGLGTLAFSGTSQSFSFSGTQFGGGGAHRVMPPVMTLAKIVRVL